MADTLFVRASDVAKEMGVSEAMAYKIIRKLNNELKEQGFVTVQGRLSRQYFEEHKEINRYYDGWGTCFFCTGTGDGFRI